MPKSLRFFSGWIWSAVTCLLIVGTVYTVCGVSRRRGGPRGMGTHWWIFKCDFYVGNMRRSHRIVMASIAASQLQGCWFDPERGLLSVQSSTPCLCGFPPGSRFSFYIPRWLGYDKLPLGVNVCVYGVLWSSLFLPPTQCFWDKLRIHPDPDPDKALLSERLFVAGAPYCA